MGVDKPFNCDVSGCGMGFTNEDHLTVHRKKHEMCLTLNSESSVKSNMILFVDQTPTPTRFIRNCEEVGLFQDLQTVNPFEETFRKAAESAKLGHPPTVGSLHASHEGDILNTPSVLIDDLEDDNSLTVQMSVLDAGSSAPLSLDEVNETNKRDGVIKELPNDGDSKDDVEKEEVYTIETKVSDDNQPTVYSSDASMLSFLPSQSMNVTDASNMTVMATTSNTIMNLSSTNITQVIEQQPSISSNAPMVHLILKLPDGSSIPVQVPTLPTVTTSEVVTHKKINVSSNASNSKSSIAKLKLRESLTQGSQGENRALRLMNEQIATSLTELANSTTDTFSFQSSNLQNKRRFGGEDNDVKRQKFLERNRAAATRCRQKRKQWVQSLESKADELAAVNQHLQNEVSLLRTEVTHLKSMLLAHKDCPVTQQQQKHLANLNAAAGSTATIVMNDGSRLVSASSTVTNSSTTTLPPSLNITGSDDDQVAPVVYRTILSREQALALLNANPVSSSNKKVSV